MSNERARDGKIYAAINAIMAEVDAIGKDTKNSQQGWFFRGIDAVMNELHPLLAKHGVFLTSEIMTHGQQERQSKSGSVMLYTQLLVRYRLYSTDGSYVETEAFGEGMDTGDKSANKAMSVAMKYALLQMLCIPTEAVDPDADRPEGPSGLAPAKSGPATDSRVWAAKIISQIATSSKDELKIIYKSISSEKDEDAKNRALACYFNRLLELAKSEADLLEIKESIEGCPEAVKDACRKHWQDKKKELKDK